MWIKQGSFFRLHQKGGRYNVVPAHRVAQEYVDAHREAQEYVDAYREAAQIGDDRRGPLFRSCKPGRRDALQEKGISRVGAIMMVKRRTSSLLRHLLANEHEQG